jgi:hypothetical protein
LLIYIHTQKLLALLNDEQRDAAAQSSYAYWIATLNQEGHGPPTTEERNKMAIRECRRHIVKRTLGQAHKDIVATIQFRKDYRVDLIRAAFHNNMQISNEDDAMRMEKMASHIKDDLGRQKGYVHGHDKEGRAVLVIRSRQVAVADDEAFVLSVLYSMERAIASTEYYTGGVQEKIIVVLDFGQFSSSLSPSMSAVQTVAKILQNRYTERLFKMVIIDPPFWMRTMYLMIKPFLDPVTTAKFILAAGDRAKHSAVSVLIDTDQAMSFMLPEGKLCNDVDMDHFLYRTPFQLGYGEDMNDTYKS